MQHSGDPTSTMAGRPLTEQGPPGREHTVVEDHIDVMNVDGDDRVSDTFGVQGLGSTPGSPPTEKARSSIQEFMELDPELYGLRRSGRQPKPAHNPNEDVAEDFTVRRKRNGRASAGSKKGGRKSRAGRRGSSRADSDDDDDDEDNYSDSDSLDLEDNDSDYGSKRKAKRGRKRKGARRSKKKHSSDEDDDGVNPFMDQESESEESESDFEESTRSYKPKKKRRIKKTIPMDLDDDDDAASGGGNRWSSRHRTRVNYDEDTLTDFEADSDEDLDDYDEEEYDTREIDRFIARRTIRRGDLPKPEDVEEDEDDHDFDPNEEIDQVQIKWKDRSYRELEWHNLEDLRYIKGFGKYKRFVEDQDRFALVNSDLIEEEEKERLSLELDEILETIQDHTIIDRIIAVRTTDPEEVGDDTQYLIKWKRLGYDECTWENANKLVEDQDAIDSFLARNSSRCTPRKAKKYSVNKRPPYKLFRDQPKYMVGGTLRDFQIAGVNWMAEQWHSGRNGILADEMGLGKTVQTVSFLSYLHHSMQLYGPFLVIVPLGTIGAWQKEFAKWAPDMNVICYQGGPKARPIIRQYEFYAKGHVKFNVLLTTYEMVILDKTYFSKIRWAFMAIDEAHRLKNEESKLHKTLIEEYTLDGKLLITGTPLQNNVQELLSLIKFLMPEYVAGREFDISLDRDDESSKQQIKELQEILNTVMLRRLKQDVEQSLPPKTELILRVPMSAMQKKYYTAIYTKEFSTLKSADNDRNDVNVGVKNISLQNIVIQLKKVSDHPYLFPNAQIQGLSKDEMLKNLVINSGKMTLLDQLLTRCKEEGHRVLIFSQMVKMLNILQEYMNYRGYKYQRLDGTIPSEARKRAMEKFNMPGSPDFVFLLSTRAGGLGLNLETADTVILFDLDWNPQNDLQAIARAHRIGQKNAVKVYRFVTAGSIEEDIVERCKRKMVLGYAIIENLENNKQQIAELNKKAPQKRGKRVILDDDPSGKPDKDELEVILKFGAQKLFSGENNDDASTNQNAMETLNLDSILAGAEETELAGTGGGKTSGSEEFMARWNAVNIEVNQLDWDSLVAVNEDKLKEASALLSDPAAEKRVQAEKEKATAAEEAEKVSAAAAAAKGGARNGRAKNRAIKRDDIDDEGIFSDDSDAEDDPKVLTKNNIRDLSILLQQWGDSEVFFEKMIESARKSLKSKDKEVIKAKIKSLVEECERVVIEYVKSMDGQKIPRGAQAKAVYLTFENVSDINARKVLERVYMMRVLGNSLGKYGNPENFRLKHSELESTSRWDTEWGIRDDSMLLIGMYKYGFGNWKPVESDADLKMQGKFFLSPDKEDAKKKPKKPHLDRRAGMLIKTLDPERAANGWLPEGVSDGSGATGEGSADVRRARGSVTTNGSEAGDERKKPMKKVGKSNLSSAHSESSNVSKIPKKTIKLESDSQAGVSDADFKFEYTEDDRLDCRDLMRPYRENLRQLRGPSDRQLPPDERRKIITSLLTGPFIQIGKSIKHIVHRERGGRKLEAQLFTYVADEYFLVNIQNKIAWHACKRAWESVFEKSKKAESQPPTPITPKPKQTGEENKVNTSSSSKPNGQSVRPSSTTSNTSVSKSTSQNTPTRFRKISQGSTGGGSNYNSPVGGHSQPNRDYNHRDGYNNNNGHGNNRGGNHGGNRPYNHNNNNHGHNNNRGGNSNNSNQNRNQNQHYNNQRWDQSHNNNNNFGNDNYHSNHGNQHRHQNEMGSRTSSTESLPFSPARSDSTSASFQKYKIPKKN